MTRDAFLAEPAEAGEKEVDDVGRVREFLEVAAIAFENWLKRLQRADGYLHSAEYDEETLEPQNDAARLKTIIWVAVEDHLKWLIAALRTAEDLTGEGPPQKTSAADLPVRWPFGRVTTTSVPRPSEEVEILALGKVLATSTSAGQIFLRRLYERQTSPETKTLDLLDSGSTAMIFWVADLEESLSKLDEDSGGLESSIRELCEFYLTPALRATRSTLTLARPIDPSQGRDSDEGKSTFH